MMVIEYLPLSSIRECPGNARIITDAAVDYVAESIRDAGFLNPVVVDKDNVLVCGHVSCRAARKAGLEIVPAVRADDLSPEEIDAFRLADNRTAAVSVWDRERLDAEFERLAESYSPVELGFDLSMIAGDAPEGPSSAKPAKNAPRERALDEFADEAFRHVCPHCGLKF